MDIPLLREIIVILGLSVIVILIFQRLKLPTILGFLLTGIIAGPYLTGMVDSYNDIELLAEIGVILLLFTIGLEFSFKQFRRLKYAVLIGGAFQVCLTILIVFIIFRISGLSLGEALFLGFLISLSSTAIVLKILQSKGELTTPHGKIILAILIFQDIIVVPMMLITPLLAGNGEDLGYEILLLGIKAILIIAFVFLSAKYIVHRLLFFILKSGNKELFLMSIITICFGVTWLTHLMGLSLALGAFLAGLIISESEYGDQAISNTLPFHEIFTSFFFVSVGMLLDLPFFINNIWIVMLLGSATLVLKSLLAGIAAFFLRIPFRTVIMVGFSLFQIGEFSFILSRTGLENEILSPEIYQYFLSISILTMAATPFVVNLAGKIAHSSRIVKLSSELGNRLYRRNLNVMDADGEKKTFKDHIVILGFGLNGRYTARAASHANIPYAVVELNAERVSRERKKGEPVFYGDAIHSGILNMVNIDQARVVVIGISDPGATRRIIATIREKGNKPYIIARALHQSEMEKLYRLGANEVITEEFETSIEIFTRVLMKYLIPKEEIEQFINLVREENYEMLRNFNFHSGSITDVELNLAGINIIPVKVSNESPVAGKTLEEIKLRKHFKITLLAIKGKEELIVNPGSRSRLMEGDILYLLGKSEHVQKFLAFMTPGSEGSGEK